MGIGHKTGGVFVISDPRYCTLRTPVTGLGQHELRRSCSEGDGFALLSAHGQATVPLPKPWPAALPHAMRWAQAQLYPELAPGVEQTAENPVPAWPAAAEDSPRFPARCLRPGPGGCAQAPQPGRARHLGAPLSSQGCLCSPGDSHQVLQLFPGYLRAALLPGLQLGTLPSSAKINVSACK